MKKVTMLLVLAAVMSVSVSAHSGRTDSKGGHNCSQASKDKGLCTGYHYHNGTAYYDAEFKHPVADHKHEKQNAKTAPKVTS